MMEFRDKVSLVILYDVCNEIIDETSTKSVALYKMAEMANRLTDIIVDEMEAIRDTTDYKFLYGSMKKELKKLA